jgi:8-oxo-dGTP pyrophosphatase MutT (NUDIX family)
MSGMNRITGQQSWSFEQIAEKLAHRKSKTDQHPGNRTPAAVAMILHQGADGLEILFIQRATHNLDPWSGHIAFPGGKLEEGEIPCQAACRETLEEIGIDLIEGTYLGRLSDIIGANLPVRVSCCLFAVDRNHVCPTLNEEVRNLFWIPLSDLRDPERHARSPVAFDDKTFDVPAIQLPVDNMPVLWGITYRLVMQLLTVLEDDRAEFEKCCRLPGTVELNEED